MKFLKKNQRYTFGIAVLDDTVTAKGVFKGIKRIAGENFIRTISLEDLNPMYLNARFVWAIRGIDLTTAEDNLDDLQTV